MDAISENALRFVVALLLASPGLILAQDNRPAGTDTTASAERQVSAAEHHVTEAVNVVRRLGMDPRMRSLLATAKGLFIVPSYKRAAAGIGAEGGAGVLLVRHDDGSWSQPVFYNTGGLSLGLQAGAQGGMLAFVLNNQKAVDAFLKKTSVSLSGSAGLTVINWNRAVERSAGAGDGDVVAWSDTKGLFGNAATVELNGIRFSQNLNNAYYRSTLSASDIIGGKSRNPQADRLAQALAASVAGR